MHTETIEFSDKPLITMAYYECNAFKRCEDEMTNRSKWIARIIEISQSLPNICPDLCVASGYSEPGYETPESGFIVLANWNPVRFDSKDKSDNTMPRLEKVLEYFGAEIEWRDEWHICDCGKCVRTSPDSHGWKPSYWLTDSDIICHECVKDDPSEYLEYLQGNPSAALTIEIDLSEHDYTKHILGCKTGWHHGQKDDSKKIAKSLYDMGVENFIFEIDETTQFYTVWSVWIHKDELRRVKSYERKQRLAA